MVNLTINNKKIQVPEGTTILAAAAQAGIKIPTLCYLKEINEIGACRVCVVEVEGKETLVASCNTAVEEGMVVYTNSYKAQHARRMNVQLILSEHDAHCASCLRSGNCTLQSVANDLNIGDVPFGEKYEQNEWPQDFPLIRDASKCIKCMRCVQICDKVQELKIWDVINTGKRTSVGVSGRKQITESDCAVCGQCITHCPVGALHERDDIDKLMDAVHDPEKIVVVQIAPAVRSAWGEGIGLSREMATEKRMAAAVRALGVDYVFDTNFSADLTIMEEGNEFLERMTHADEYSWPMFTSCCPGWVRFVKSQYPDMVKNLSTAKSPQQMFGAVAKSYFAEKIGADPGKICSISIMPCVSKKMEATLPDMYSAGGGADVDIVLTTREFARLVRAEHIAPALLTEEAFDSPLGESTGAGVIFGVTGGVMEAALRTAYYCVEGVNPPADTFSDVRGFEGRREAEFSLGGRTLRTCTVSGLKNARDLIEDLRAGTVHYDFVEVMACPGGCVGGGGQPILDGVEMADVRGPRLYKLDEQRPLRFSHDNPGIKKLYAEYMGAPLGEKAHQLLHTHN